MKQHTIIDRTHLYRTKEVDYSIDKLINMFESEGKPVNINPKDKFNHTRDYWSGKPKEISEQNRSLRQKSQDNNRYRKVERW